MTIAERMELDAFRNVHCAGCVWRCVGCTGTDRTVKECKEDWEKKHGTK